MMTALVQVAAKPKASYGECWPCPTCLFACCRPEGVRRWVGRRTANTGRSVLGNVDADRRDRKASYVLF